MNNRDLFLAEHADVTRRHFLRLGLAGAASAAFLRPVLATPAERVKALEPYFTEQDSFQDVSRGSPKPHSLPEEKRKEVGLTRETWKLEVIADPDKPATIGKPLTKQDGTALDFEALLKLGETKGVRFVKIMTCLNLGCPLGNGVWEGVPLRDVLWMTKPKENLRRVIFHGYHNDDPKQLFRGSLPASRVFEDPFDLPPVILCYKLNGDWLTPKRGGPVRMVIPESYGFKNIKWLTHVYLSNLFYANDTYGDSNNDVDSPQKTFAATLQVPTKAKANEKLPITGYAQVGISGISKVQVWISPADKMWPEDDPYFTKAPWVDAEILGPPENWGSGVKSMKGVWGFDASGKPKTWPLRFAKAHWAAVLPGLPAGEYSLRSRTIDEKGHAQPMPRPFKKLGRNDIETVKLTIS